MKTKNFMKIATLLFVTLFAGFMFQACNKNKMLTQAELEGYWVLKNMNGADAKGQFAGALPTLQFNFNEGTVSGTGGCNQYGGAYTYKDGIFSAPDLAVTQMLCTEDNNEGQFLLELTNDANQLSLVNGLLTISRAGKPVLEFEKGAAPVEVNKAVVLDSETLSGEWRLKVMDGVDAGEKFKGNKESVPTLTFDFATNKISGNGGCNRYNATFSLNNELLVVGPIMSTKMACPNLEGESQFSQAIADTSNISLPNADILQLAKNGTVLLEFEKVKADESAEKK